METKRTRRTFTQDFKKQLVLRVIEQKEKPAAVAQENGINVVSLYQWIKDYEKTSGVPSSTEESTIVPTATETPAEQPVQERKRPVLKINRKQAIDADLFSAPAPVAEETPIYREPTPAAPAVEEWQSTIRFDEPTPAPVIEPQPMAQYTPEPEVLQQIETITPTEPVEASAEENVTAYRQPRNREERQNRFGKKNFRNGRDNRDNRQNRKEFSEEEAPAQATARTEDFGGEIMPDTDYENFVKPVAPKPPRHVPTAAEGRSWRVSHALDQRPNYKAENEHYGYVDAFTVPAEDLDQVWEILKIMQDKVDKRAFNEMCHQRELNVPDEVLNDPRNALVPGPNVPNKPWLRKPRMHQIAEEFFQTTPDYAKSVYEEYAGLLIRLAKNSEGSPIVKVENEDSNERMITIDFSKFDRFVDDFYGDFVRECKKVMMELNPKEYPSLNAFIRIPDEPMWNPKLWAGLRTFNWRKDETLSHAWIRFAISLKNNRRNNRFYSN